MPAVDAADAIWRAAAQDRGLGVVGVEVPLDRPVVVAAAGGLERAGVLGRGVGDSVERGEAERLRRSPPRHPVPLKPSHPLSLPAARGRPPRRVREAQPPQPLSKWGAAVPVE